MNPIQKTALGLIKSYQRWKKLFTFIEGSCRFTPSCSSYTYQAIERYGTIKGLILGLGRIVRCYPYSKGGYDPVR